MKHWVLLFVIALSPAYSQDEEMLPDPHVRDLFNEVFSGELAKDHVIQITRHRRIQGSRGYRNAAQYVLGQLRGFGYGDSEAYVESFRSDRGDGGRSGND